MAKPSTRQELKDYCLRKLGFPVIDINVDDDQLEDRVDDALQKYRDFHYDGTEITYLAHKLTNADILQVCAARRFNRLSFESISIYRSRSRIYILGWI